MKILLSDLVIGARFRREFDAQKLSDLKTSMQEVGLINPITVYKDTSGKFLLVAGERRVKAAMELGWKFIEATLTDDIDEVLRRYIELAENIYREDMDHLDQARLINEIHRLQIEKIGAKKNPTDPNDPGWTLKKTAQLVGESEANVSRKMTVAMALEMPEFAEGLQKTKDLKEAYDLLRVEKKKFDTKQKASAIEERIRLTPEDVLRKNLIDSYICLKSNDDVMSSGFLAAGDQLADNSVDFIEADPPYGIDLKNTKDIRTHIGGQNISTYTEVASDIYAKWFRKMAEICYRVLRPNRFALFWFAPEPWFAMIYATLIDVGFKGDRVPGLWIKNKGQTNQPNIHLARSYEMFFYMRKGNPVLNKPGRLATYDYRMIPPEQKVHPTERPIEMMEDILFTFTDIGSTIMVPFLGSGNTLLAAANLKCQAFGFEIDENLKSSFIAKVGAGKPGTYKSYTATTTGG